MSDDAHATGPLRLPPEPRSAARARRYVHGVLETAGRGAWVDAATTAVSELVTNAVLHAHTEIEVSATVATDHVRVAIRDYCPLLPSSRGYDDYATTGRGLSLVAAMSVEHGVEALDDGKVVWFTVGDGPAAELSPDELLAAWDDDGDFSGVAPEQHDSGSSVDPAQVEVVLRGMPPTLWLAAREHHDALLRELALLQAGGQVPDVDLFAADRARFAISSALQAVVERARAEGTARVPLPQYHPGALPPVPAAVDLRLLLPREDIGAFALLQDALDEGEALARAGRLLVRPGLPEIVAVRDWAAEQVIAQAAGSPAARWPGADDDRFTSREPGSLPDWDTTAVSTAAVGVIAVDDGNRIIAVSPPLGRIVGHAVDDLVGRRVVVLIPPRFREAHVAGFSRHLSTGDARALAADLTLPVLCADGSEVDCRFRIEAEQTGTGRNVYVAWITPL